MTKFFGTFLTNTTVTDSFSHHQYAEIVTEQKVGTWLALHRRAFEWFNGIPESVILDNPKCAIIRASYYDPEVQRSYAELAEGYGFLLIPCPPRDPKKKGRVESGVKYIKSAFLPLRTFRSFADANQQLRAWILSEAGTRIHGTTRQQPLTLFAEGEKSFLSTLPDRPVQLATWVTAKVHGDAHVVFDKNRYSVPYSLIRQNLWIKGTDTTISVFREQEMVAIHPRLLGEGRHHTLDDHLPHNALAYKLRDPEWCLKKAQEVGPSCRELIEKLFSDRVLDNLRAAQGILRLVERHGPSRVEPACARTLSFDNPRYSTVKVILDRGLDLLPLEAPAGILSPPSFLKGVFLMNPMPELSPLLKQLRLSGILDSLETRNQEAITAKLAYPEFLGLLIQDEVARRCCTTQAKRLGCGVHSCPIGPPPEGFVKIGSFSGGYYNIIFLFNKYLCRLIT